MLNYCCRITQNSTASGALIYQLLLGNFVPKIDLSLLAISRTGVRVVLICGKPFDDGMLLAKLDRDLDVLRRCKLANVHFLFQDEALFDDEDFFQNGDDGHIVFDADAGSLIHDAVDGNARDFDVSPSSVAFASSVSTSTIVRTRTLPVVTMRLSSRTSSSARAMTSASEEVPCETGWSGMCFVIEKVPSAPVNVR
jgi:hypothetical protein